MTKFGEEKAKQLLKDCISEINDFPIPGIVFKDITPIFTGRMTLRILKDLLYDHYKGCRITKVIGVEARGFYMAPILALELEAGFIPARKKGKLPGECHCVDYTLEYGTASLEIQKGSITEDDTVLIYDDVLATGGSVNAVIKLLNEAGVKKIYVCTLLEIEELNGKETLPTNISFYSLLS
jgi:adenine phosphoribosyltransferase